MSKVTTMKRNRCEDILILRKGKVLATRRGDAPCDPFNFPDDAVAVRAGLAEASGDLLEACKAAESILNDIEEQDGADCALYRGPLKKLRAAIAKAEATP